MPEQIGLLVLFALFALLQFVVRALRARRMRQARPARPDAMETPDAVPPPVPRAPSPAVRDTRPRPAALPRVARTAQPVDARRSAPSRQRARFGPRQLREAIVLATVLAPPRSLEPPASDQAGAAPRA
jgi:hypothetical protein